MLLLSLLVLVVLVLVSYAYMYSQTQEPQPVHLDIELRGSQTLGSPTAPVTLVEFSDYECPFCAEQANSVLPALYQDYVATGRVQYVFVNFPLPKHRSAPKAAQAALCAGEQGRYWRMHDRLFQTGSVAFEGLLIHAAEIGLSNSSFRECLDSGRYREVVAQDHRKGLDIEVQVTPTLFLGVTHSKSAAVTARFDGMVTYRSLRKSIDNILISSK